MSYLRSIEMPPNLGAGAFDFANESPNDNENGMTNSKENMYA